MGGKGRNGISWFPIYVFSNLISTLVTIIAPPQSPAVVLRPDALPPNMPPNTKHLANGTVKDDITTWHALAVDGKKTSNEVEMVTATECMCE